MENLQYRKSFFDYQTHWTSRKKEFTATVLDPKYETFIVYVTSLISTPFDTNVYLSYRFQISGLITKEALMKISNKYVNLADVFFLDLASKLLKHTKINNHTIKLVDS